MRFTVAFIFTVSIGASALADRFTLMTGVDPNRYPGAGRAVAPSPGPGFPGTFFDGDRLAGTADVGPAVPYAGTGTPLYSPNEFGSLSMLYRRGSVPAGPNAIPFLGIEFLGGPLLDLDGNVGDGVRSLVPVAGASPAEIPGTQSFVELSFDQQNGSVTLLNVDIAGNNEGGPNVGPAIATIIVTLAGTAGTCATPGGCIPGPAINAAIDTRTSPLIAINGASGALAGNVWFVPSLGYEIWEDTIDPNSASASVLGTLQYLGSLRGWLISRDADTGQFPALAGEGLASTLWPRVDTSRVGQVFNTANGLAGGTATIAGGTARDSYSAANNGGLPLTSFPDLGAYLDAVVVPRVPAQSNRFVYLEAAGFGINNSNDPVFLDTVGYDVVLVAYEDRCNGFVRCDANCDGNIDNFDIDAFVLALSDPSGYSAAYQACNRVCNNDANSDGNVDNFDIDAFVACLTGAP